MSPRADMVAMRHVMRFAAVLVVGWSLVSCSKPPPPAPPRTIATIETEHGAIEFELLSDVAPKAAENFRLLAQRGCYNGLTFHRLVKGFMIQGGDPKGDGSGGESAWGGTFADEIDPHSPRYQAGYHRGDVAMANTGKDTNRSQFFIVQTDFPLPPQYTIFGKVTHGIEVVDAIIATPTTTGSDGRQTKPVTPIVMKKVAVRTE